ncbi:DoxX family protein [Flavobacterium sedimenticola]|uniref:DoxX family protein n=1 Tax=Flavobacterium sedimenticola TaxID=3043286 RepID=A0ABT6XT24_9FLAO|nr:DoxX family protein [Flavobacterium sedimenticola]MDI9258168.1 DoxX family protein [Flavobacterium sedimenticola]
MKNSKTNTIFTVARALMGITFLIAGLHKIMAWEGPAAWMASKGIPMVTILLGMATFIEIVGALLLLVNQKVKWTSLILAIFLLVVTVSMHTFWNMDGMMFQAAFLDFIQNIAIIGGLLGLAVADQKITKSN